MHGFPLIPAMLSLVGCLGTAAALAAPPLPLDQQIAYFAKRVSARPNDYISRGILGRLYLQAAKEQGDGSRYDDAEDTFRGALKINPRDIRSQLGLADCLMAQHRFADGLELASEALQAEPENVEALAAVGDAQLELGKYEEAAASFNRLHKALSTAPVLARLARIAELHGKQQEAIDLLDRAHQQAKAAAASDQESSWYLQQIGEVELQRGKLDEAAGRFGHVLESIPLHNTALPSLAYVRALQGRYTESEKLYEKALKNRPSEALLIAFGEVHEAQGEFAEAKNLYVIAQSHLEHAVDVEEEAKAEQKLAAKEPVGPSKSKELKEHHHHFGDLPHSHSHRYAEAHQRQLSLLYSEHDMLPALALQLARAELKVRQDIYTHDALAWALYRNGQFKEAAQSSDEALRFGTRDARLWFHAGMIQLRLGNRDEARKRLGLVAEINPNFSLIDRDLARETLEELASGE